MFETAPAEWERTTLGKVVTRGGGSIQTGPFGSQLHASDYVPVGIPSIMPVNIGDNRLIREGIACITEADAQRLSKHIVRKGDIIYSRRGDVERRALVRDAEEGWFCGTGCLKIRLGSGVVLPEFAAFYLGHPEVREWIVRHAVGATMPNLNTGIMEAIPFLLPPPSEQEAIAAVLSSLDDKIEQNRWTARTLERLARAIFKAWFVDFEPVKAKAAGALSFPSMPQPAFEALPEILIDIDNKIAPKGWEIKALSEVCEVNPPRPLRKGAMATYLEMKHMPTDGHVPTAWTTRECGSGARFQNGDTLVARITPCLENGKTAFVDFLAQDEVAWGSTEYIVLRPKQPLHPLFAYCIARTSLFREFAIQNMSGTSGRQRVPYNALSKYYVAVPPRAVAEAIGEILQPLFERSAAANREIRSLARMRDALLPELFAGRVQLHGAGT